MPISYTVHNGFNLIVTRYSGYVTDEEYRQAYGEIYDGSFCQPGFDELLDMREMEGSGFTADTMRDIAWKVRQFYEGSGRKPRLAVIHATGHQFGISRMYGALADYQDAEIVERFDDVEAALEWLDAIGLPADGIHGG